MKTIPIISLCRYDNKNVILHKFMKQEAKKINSVLFITPPEQKQKPLELILEKENEKFLEKIKQYNKDFFGI